MIHLMTTPPDDHHHCDHGLSLRKALAYTDCSRNTYYYSKKVKEKQGLFRSFVNSESGYI